MCTHDVHTCSHHTHTHTRAHHTLTCTHSNPHTHTTHTDELIRAIRQDIAVASEKLEDPPMKELAVQLDDRLRTKHRL